MMILVILLLAVSSFCQQVVVEPVDTDKQDVAIAWLNTNGGYDVGKGIKKAVPVVYWKPKNGSPLALPDSITKEAARLVMVARVKALDAKLATGDAAAAEVQEALHLAIKMLANVLKLQ